MHLVNAEQLPQSEFKQKTPVVLPQEFDRVILKHPELHQLLHGFAQRDPGTFLHCITVFFTSRQLLSDLFARYQYPDALQKATLSNIPFFLLHDIGKAAAHRDIEAAQKRVHPIRGVFRPTEEMAFHWIHPQLSASLLLLYKEHVANNNLQKLIEHWAQLSMVHDEQLNPYLSAHPAALENGKYAIQIEQLDLPDFLAMLVFLVSDTAMAMGLPRPNRASTWSTPDLVQVLTNILSKQERAMKIVPAGKQSSTELNRVKKYIIASVLSSVKELQATFSAQQMMQPTEFHSKQFHTASFSDTPSLALFNTLVGDSWRQAEAEWLHTVHKMEQNGVFRFAK